MAAAGAPPPSPAAPWLRHHSPRHPSPAVTVSGSAVSTRRGSGRKHGERLLSSLHSIPTDEDATVAADRLVRKFLASSPKAAALDTLSYLLSDASSSSTVSPSHHLALPMYRRITRTPWFRWNPKLTAAVIPLLEKLGNSAEAGAMVGEGALRLEPRELAVFYCDLIESFARHGLRDKVFETRVRLLALHLPLCKGGHEAMVKALCLLGSPGEAEQVLKEMGTSGVKPSPFVYRVVLQSYGRLGLLAQMNRMLGTTIESGRKVDTVCANMVLSCYGDCGELPEMVTWIRQMRGSGIPFSARTYNSVLNSCPRLCSMLRTSQTLPLSLLRLGEELEGADCAPTEALLVRELVSSDVLVQALQWSPSEGKLDLHGCHLGSAFVILLQWVDELKGRLLGAGVEGKGVPVEISIVCGSGRHSSAQGGSPVKRLACEMMFRMESPLKIDRKNVGRLVARGAAVRDWLMKMEGF